MKIFRLPDFGIPRIQTKIEIIELGTKVKIPSDETVVSLTTVVQLIKHFLEMWGQPDEYSFLESLEGIAKVLNLRFNQHIN